MATTRTVLYAGVPQRLTYEEDAALLEVVRAAFDVRSASRACELGTCGTCRLLVDGGIVNACGVRWRDVHDGAVIEAYESLATEPAAVRAVEAFSAERPTRCSLCVGALGVTAVALARQGNAGDVALDAALEKATCMCTGRGSLRRALLGRPGEG